MVTMAWAVWAGYQGTIELHIAILLCYWPFLKQCSVPVIVIILLYLCLKMFGKVASFPFQKGTPGGGYRKSIGVIYI